MPTTEDAIRKKVARVGDLIKEQAWTVGRDEKKAKRMLRRWKVLEGALTLATTLAARKLAARAWGVLTGELPPARR